MKMKMKIKKLDDSMTQKSLDHLLFFFYFLFPHQIFNPNTESEIILKRKHIEVDKKSRTSVDQKN